MPTRRGAALVVIALGTYLAGRVLGTWELYLLGLSLGSLVPLASLMVVMAGRRLEARRWLDPEEPRADTVPRYSASLSNNSFFPTPAMRIVEKLEPVMGRNVCLDLSPLGPRKESRIEEQLEPVRRGVHRLGRLSVELGDPLGLARRTCRLGDDLTLTIVPRIADLTSLAFFGKTGLGELTRARLARSLSSTDVRSVRPHMPGEPLNRIDWKSTARTGALMLRETEEPSRTDVVVILDGSESADLGEPPETSFEAAVAAAGSVGDYVLRQGLAVTFLLHEGRDNRAEVVTGDDVPREIERYDGRSRGSRQMLERLAAAEAGADKTLGDMMNRHEVVLNRGAAVVVISPAGGRFLQSALVDMAARGVPVFLIHVDALSFAGYDSETDAPLEGRPTRAATSGPHVDRRRFLLSLAAAGVPSVVLKKGDDLTASLSVPSPGTHVASAESPAETVR